MAIRNVVKFGDDILNKNCRTVDKFDKKLHMMLDDMAETMDSANGVGLAAPQIGILKKVAIIDIGDGLVEFINPEILKTAGTQDGMEGCLSNPGEYGMVERPNYVKAKAQDRDGRWFEIEGEELMARAMCHEFDHLCGVVFTSKASRMLSPEELEEMQEEDEE